MSMWRRTWISAECINMIKECRNSVPLRCRYRSSNDLSSVSVGWLNEGTGLLGLRKVPRSIYHYPWTLSVPGYAFLLLSSIFDPARRLWYGRDTVSVATCLHILCRDEECCSEMFLKWRMASSGMLRRVALVRTDVSEVARLFLVHRFLSPWWRRSVPPKRRFLQELHDVTSQKTQFFIVKPWKPQILHFFKKMFINISRLVLKYF
jgi:hypothetical protein